MNDENTKISRGRATRAGKVFCTHLEGDPEYVAAIRVAEQWRAQHINPTAQCFAELRKEIHRLPDAVATYRMKRMESIIRKLQRTQSTLRLGELDDIGGCRLIVDDVDQVYAAVAHLRQSLALKKSGGEKDYIAYPRSTGYRSYHLLTAISDDDGPAYHVEVQIRTKLQHYWATTVEMIGEIYGQEYKSPQVAADADGTDRERLDFFALISCLFALEGRGDSGFRRVRTGPRCVNCAPQADGMHSANYGRSPSDLRRHPASSLYA